MREKEVSSEEESESGEEETGSETEEETVAEYSPKKVCNTRKLKVDDLCMAIFAEDGLIYPAKIVRIFTDKENKEKCIVRYLYYLNEEEKYLDELFEYEESGEVEVEGKESEKEKTVSAATSIAAYGAIDKQRHSCVVQTSSV